MRAQAKRLRHEEEEESAFISMTDMTVGFLFIMMILLAFFASQMQDPDAVSRSEYDRSSRTGIAGGNGLRPAPKSFCVSKPRSKR